MQRRKFSREYKLEAVRLVRERGVGVAQASRDLDVHENVLRKWVREYGSDPAQAFPGQGQMKPEQLEIERLRKEVAKLKAERDNLKKGRRLLCEGRDMKFAFIAKHRSIWPVAWLCEALGVSRSGFHAWLNRSPSQHARYDEALLDKIKDSFKDSDRTYGARRVWHDLLAEGLSCGLHRVERLMRENALRARPRRRGLPKDDGERPVIMPNVLDRQFAAARPNQKWVADFTYLWTAEGWLYVAVVIDLFSRRVVGWSMSTNMTAQLVTDALIMAIWRRGKPDALLHHSDQGSQYTSEQFQRLMADHGITCSMSRSGNVWDNAAMESFFSSLKTERTARKVYRTRDDAKADVFDYIERFYNPKRRHSTLGYLSPMEFENKVGLA
ncbi:IS3 family transposase (plasmid) [Rhizobium rosettiformans]|uniref:IS3 family transposase n=3 Tax=Rhizobium TaxID=379 RepID=A0ABX7ESK2_9HYPH|nr:IS3 family transposase [Rhizobium rosettiformans]QRF50545.1 IS3 family transposase [Rhizobium rosettiformans]QRF51303.1 IS3 family transposase [Rhizobium rosettiformans]QRF51614.1 IS3 family transposase [Rhizobium rosettiformans]QRF53498.1 IS3 family transposase [Rhizobium rosettiformans]QRF54337.1 IS3 family transposase [Rhizobium rosettiformans]